MNQIVEFNAANLPAHLQQTTALAAAVNQSAAAGTGGNSVDHISIKGGRFTIHVQGQQPKTVEAFSLNVIIVHGNPGMTKAFFGTKWKEGETEAPVCASDDGVAPRADSSAVQCASCAACPNNAFGSYINPQTGAESKACADKKTIAIVTPGRADGLMLRLQVPAASLKDYGAYIKSLPVAYYGVVTKISFDTNSPFPKLKFEPVAYVSEADFAIVDRRHKEDKTKAIAGVAGFNGNVIPTTTLASPPAHLAVAGPTPEQLAAKAAQEQAALAAQQQAALAAQQATALAAQQQAALVAQQAQALAAQQAAALVAQQAAAAQTTAVADPIAAILAGGGFGEADTTVVATQTAATSTARVPGQPSPGKKRRTKVEMAEDAALGIGKAEGETSEEETVVATQATQAVDTGGFGEVAVDAGGFGEPVATQTQAYQQPANQPQVVSGGAVDAFAGWDD